MTQLRDALKRAGFETSVEARKRLKRERDAAIARALNPRGPDGKFRSVKADRAEAARIAAELRRYQGV